MSDVQLTTAHISATPNKQKAKAKGAGVTGSAGQVRARQARQAAQAGDHFRHKLVLNAWVIEQFGFNPLHQPGNALPIRELGASIAKIPEGLGEDGLHRFYHAFKATLPQKAKVTAADLLRYEENIVAHTAKLNLRRNHKIQWKYFQWLTLLFVEYYLDRFFNHPYTLLDSLNEFVLRFNQWRVSQSFLIPIESFTADELNKVCLQNATGSGKTLLMHINLLQFRHHAKAANKIGNYTRAILLTPSEDLTAQHLGAFEESGQSAQRFVPDLTAAPSAELTRVDALELSKLGDEDKDKTVAIRNFGDSNLLLVDEGHIGLGSQNESGFLARRDALSAKGFVFEYSATFAQAVEAAKDDKVTQAYAKSVLFDYSYRYFYEDGYGKDYQIFNLDVNGYGSDDVRRLYLTGSLLSFYQQLRLFEEQRTSFAQFNLEKPLWVFVGASVVKAIGGTQEDQAVMSDVSLIVQFIADFLHDRMRSISDIEALLTLDGHATGLIDGDGHDIFSATFIWLKQKYLVGETALLIYDDIMRKLFNHAPGGSLTLTRIKGETAEVRLHVGTSDKPFGVINVGDAPALIRKLETDCHHVEVDESEFATGNLFGEISDTVSPVNLLIGSRKFISGWDCWRVSTLGLMHVGKSEGALIIQLFGRGVRLKGNGWSLKRSSALSHLDVPKYIEVLETLGVFGVKSNYMSEFRNFLEKEGLPGNAKKEIRTIPMNVVHDFGKRLMVITPKTKKEDGREFDFRLDGALPTFGDHVPHKLTQTPVTVNWYPRIQGIIGGVNQANQNEAPLILNSVKLSREHLVFVNWDQVWFELEAYKRLRGWANMNVAKDKLLRLFEEGNNAWYVLQIPPEQLALTKWSNVETLRHVVLELLKRYMDAYYNYCKKAFYEPRLELKPLEADHPNMQVDGDVYQLVIDASQQALLQDVEALQREIALHQTNSISKGSLDAIVNGVHLFSPLLHARQDSKITISPVPLKDSEFCFVRDLEKFIASQDGKTLLTGAEVFLLRNKARGGGIGFFEAGAFYPDFIMWLLHDNKQYVVFIEPHGLKHEGQASKKIMFYQIIKEIESRINESISLSATPVILDSFILSPTPMAELAWEWKTLDQFAGQHVLMMKDEPTGYIRRMFKTILGN